MSPIERRRRNVKIARQLIKSVLDEVVKTLKHTGTSEWDGLEVRELLADKFEHERHMGACLRKAEFRRRLKEFRNTVLIHNL